MSSLNATAKLLSNDLLVECVGLLLLLNREFGYSSIHWLLFMGKFIMLLIDKPWFPFQHYFIQLDLLLMYSSNTLQHLAHLRLCITLIH